MAWRIRHRTEDGVPVHPRRGDLTELWHALPAIPCRRTCHGCVVFHDLWMPIVRSEVPRGRLRNFSTSPAKSSQEWHGTPLVTAAELVRPTTLPSGINPAFRSWTPPRHHRQSPRGIVANRKDSRQSPLASRQPVFRHRSACHPHCHASSMTAIVASSI